MQKFIPLFPLKTVVYPGQKLNLHIFEERYKELLKDVESGEISFGIPTVVKGQISEYGTEMRLNTVYKRYDDGRLDIKTEGVRVFRLIHFMKEIPDKAYSGGVVSFGLEEKYSERKLNTKVIQLMKELEKVLNLDKPIFPDYSVLSSYDIAHYCGLSDEDKYFILTIRDERERQAVIFEHLRNKLPELKSNAQLIKQIGMNGHFRDEISPEF